MNDMRKLIASVAMILIAVFIRSSIVAETQPILISGTVSDVLTKISIRESTVLLWDMEIGKLVGNVSTTENGTFEFLVENVVRDHNFIVYAYHRNAGIFDYIPGKTRTFDLRFGPPDKILFELVQAAEIRLIGDIRYVKSPNIRPAPSYLVSVITDTNNDQALESVTTYGPDSEDARFLRLPKNLVVVPAEKKTSLFVRARVLMEGSYVNYGFLEFMVDNNGAKYSLPQGKYIEEKLPAYALGQSIAAVQSAFVAVYENLSQAQRAGFYVTDQKEEVQQARDRISEAQTELVSGRYDDSITNLRIAYLLANVVGQELDDLRGVAMAGVAVIPLFLSFFAVAIGLISFEKLPFQALSAAVYYVLEILVFYLVYPGAHIIGLATFGISAIGSLAIPLVLGVLVSMIWKERLTYGKISLLSLLPTMTSMAKRNVKRKIFRTTLTVASVTFLILAMTALTSVSRVFELVVQPYAPPAKYNGFFVRNVPTQPDPSAPYLPISFEDVSWLASKTGVQLVSPKIESIPSIQDLGEMIGPQGRYVIRGIVGLSMDEKAFTDLESRLMSSGELVHGLQNNGIVISRILASRIGAIIGSSVRFEMRSGGILVQALNFTISGLLDDASTNDLVELDSQPFLPRRLVYDNTTRSYAAVVCSPDSVIVTDYDVAFRSFSSANAIMVSRIMFTMSGIESDVTDLVTELVYSREYSVYVPSGSQMNLHHLGYSVKITGIGLMVPIVIVALNIALTMVNVVQGRDKEIRTLTAVGFNPSHVALLVIFESLVMGLIGGGLGYIGGLMTYQVFSALSIELAVRPKLEWYWSVGGMALAIVVSLIAAIRPSMDAAMAAIPSGVRKASLSGTQKEKREQEIYKTFIEREYTVPIRIREPDKQLFVDFFTGRLKEVETGFLLRVENLKYREEQTEAGTLLEWDFRYVYGSFASQNRVLAFKRSDADAYDVRAKIEPEKGVPDKFVENIMNFIKDIAMGYVAERDKPSEQSR